MFSNHSVLEKISNVLVKYKHHQSSVIVSVCMFWIKALFLFGLQTTLLDKYLRKMGMGELEMKVNFTYSMISILEKRPLQVFGFLHSFVMKQNHILAKKEPRFLFWYNLFFWSKRSTIRSSISLAAPTTIPTPVLHEWIYFFTPCFIYKGFFFFFP